MAPFAVARHPMIGKPADTVYRIIPRHQSNTTRLKNFQRAPEKSREEAAPSDTTSLINKRRQRRPRLTIIARLRLLLRPPAALRWRRGPQLFIYFSPAQRAKEFTAFCGGAGDRRRCRQQHLAGTHTHTQQSKKVSLL